VRNTESKWYALAIFVAAYLLFPWFLQVKRATAAAIPPAALHAISGGHDYEHEYAVQDQETIRKSFPLAAAAGHRSLAVDIVFGSIEVTGTDGSEVQMVVNKKLRAETKEKLEVARKEVTLEITDQPDSLKLYVNGPFRCQCDNCCDGCNRCNGSHWDHQGYMVIWDFQLQVPRDIDLELRTVNSGHIQVANVTGAYIVRNVNGTIEMTNVAGSGTAHTVNGHVKVTFRDNPRESSSFVTVNGAVDLYFSRNLSADFRLKTFNGEIYTDFPVTALPAQAMREEHEGSKVVYRANRYTGARVGSGGPEIKIETLNGDIRLLEKQ
jgi:hypothetical protein